jgi:hypothetical protein
MGSVNHTTVAGGVGCATCEWCERVASYRVKCRTRSYQRFACSAPHHRAKADKLASIDLGQLTREAVVNPTGFDVNGRMLGPKGCQ